MTKFDPNHENVPTFSRSPYFGDDDQDQINQETADWIDVMITTISNCQESEFCRMHLCDL